MQPAPSKNVCPQVSSTGFFRGAIGGYCHHTQIPSAVFCGAKHDANPSKGWHAAISATLSQARAHTWSHECVHSVRGHQALMSRRKKSRVKNELGVCTGRTDLRIAENVLRRHG